MTTYSIQNNIGGFTADNMAAWNLGGRTITYSLRFRSDEAGDTGDSWVLGAGMITNQDPLLSNPYTDFHLKISSPAVGSGSAGQCMGRYSAWVSPASTTPNASTSHTIKFTTTFAGSVPADGNIYIRYPASFRFAASLSATYSGGSLTGSLAAVRMGNGLVKLMRSGGSASTAGTTESIVLTGVTNSATAGNTYRITWWTKLGDDSAYIDYPDDSNDFFIGSVVSPILGARQSAMTTLKGNAGRPVPGSTLIITVFCSNTGTAANWMRFYAGIPANTVFKTNSLTVPAGWTNQYSTNASPNQAYLSANYFNTNTKFAVSRIKWVRIKKPAMAGSSNATFTYQVIIK